MQYCLASIVSHYAPIFESIAILLFLIGEVLLASVALLTLLPLNARSELNLPEFFVPGLFAAVAFAETWSLIGGLTPWANIGLIFAIIMVALVRRRLFVGTIRRAVHGTRLLNLLLLVPCLVFAAMNALTNGFCHDMMLYHLAAVRWVAEFGSVPGLANLHGRFGFNSALHPLAALFGWPFGIEIGREFVNPVIIVSVCGVLLQGLRLRGKEFFTPASIYACLLFPLALRLLFSSCLSSPQPDVTGAALAALVAWYLREEVTQEAVPDRQMSSFLACLMASGLVAMFKLSYAVFGIAAAGIAIGTIFVRRRHLRLILGGVTIVFIFSVPWLCRGYITSGYPFYPSEFGRINFDWMVPAASALFEKAMGL
jgi:hypothetical protein